VTTIISRFQTSDFIVSQKELSYTWKIFFHQPQRWVQTYTWNMAGVNLLRHFDSIPSDTVLRSAVTPLCYPNCAQPNVCNSSHSTVHFIIGILNKEYLFTQHISCNLLPFNISYQEGVVGMCVYSTSRKCQHMLF
jgi:hypothetical protein